MTILLVEDDVGIGRAIVQGLAAQGLEVRWLRAGAGLLEQLARGDWRALILDVGLPDADGFALCRAVRSAGFAVPVLMLTARGTLDDRLDGFAAGADDYLPKPFAFAELVARVKVLVRRAGQLRPAPIHWQGLDLDPDRHEARWQGAPVRLDPQSFQILVTLAAARGAIVPRPVLLERVWGDDAIVSANAVDVAISTLRRRLAEAATPFAIRAARGQGFALEPAEPPRKRRFSSFGST